MVRVETPIEPETSAALPDASTTIIVSPIARPKPSTSEAEIPGHRGGKDHPRDHLEASEPSASAAVRYESGTARSASSETVKMSGQIGEREPDAGDQRVQTVLGAERRLYPGREHDEREEADDHRRDAGQELDHRLDDLALAPARELGDVDRRGDAEAAPRSSSATSVTLSDPDDQRNDVVLRDLADRLPHVLVGRRRAMRGHHRRA